VTSAFDWPGLPEGFDVVRKGKQLFLALRADVGELVVSGITSPVPLMSYAMAERASEVEKATALAERLKDMPASRAVSVVLRWWKAHREACAESGLPEWKDDTLREACRGNEGEPLDMIPRTLEAWRSNRKRQLESERVARQIASVVKIEDYDKLFPAAASTRRIVAVLGPTNSGKTHMALERLSRARSGYFCGPLRLLSLEVYERLNREFETPCSLVTGEERRIMEGADHVSCTVEMVDPQRRVEVAVIDEAQMIADRQRGWAWTQAIACANAEEVYVLGSPQIRGVLERFAAKLGVPIEVRELRRLSPLRLQDRPLGNTPQQGLKNVGPGDALVVFTRRDCLALRDDLMQAGHEVACVYGALSPEARQAEANRFTTGEATVIVATDAIGLGLNLKGLRRAVLVASQKYDGQSRHDVPLDLVRQIAGRAGRYGHTEDAAGLAAGLTQDEHELVARALAVAPEPIELGSFPVAPSGEVLKRLEEASGEKRLSVLLKLFVKHCAGGGYAPQLPGDAMERAFAVDGLDLPIETRFVLTQVPVSGRDEWVQDLWMRWCKAVEQDERCGLDFVEGQGERMTLEQAERNVQLLNGYCWLAMRMPSLFFAEQEGRELVRKASAVVSSRLRSKFRLGQGLGGGRNGRPTWYWERRVDLFEMSSMWGKR
jgi:ATP-dependent RNA helicase SUPV3L1/SUV3